MLPASLWAQDLVRLSPFGFRLTGQSSLTFAAGRSNGVSTTASQTSHDLNAVVSSAGYVWKPWFSRLSLTGTGRAVRTTSQTSVGQDATSHSLGGTASGRITFFPTSWFPTTASLSHGVRGVDVSGEERRVLTDTRFQLQHQYTGRGWEPDVVAFYTYAVTEAEGDESLNQDFSVAVTKTIGLRQFQTSFQWMEQEEGGRVEDTSYVLQGSHDYATNWGADFSDFASYVLLEERSTETEIRQYSNSYHFRLPQRFFLTTSVRIADTERRPDEGEASAFSSLAGSGSISKLYDNGLRLSGSASYLVQEVEEAQREQWLGTAGVQYTRDDLYFYGWDGTANTSLTLTAQEGDQSGGMGATWSAGHGWRLAVPTAEHLDLEEWRFSQDVTSTLKSVEDNERDGELALVQSLDYTLQGDALGGLFAQLSDRRVLNGEDDESQRLQLVLDKQFWKGGSGTLTGGWTGFVTRTDDNQGEDVRAGAAGVLRYNKANFLRIHRLNYFATASMNFNRTLSGDEDDDSREYQFEQGVNWVFGRLGVKGRMYYDRTETDDMVNEDLGVSMTVTRRWDSL